LLFQLLRKDPSQRLGVSGNVDVIRQHPFFNGIDWQALLEKRVQPPKTADVVVVSSTDPVFISFH
jgi:hypothetical protein